MSSYNLINGHRASENKDLLTGILRDEWGFNGLVTTDWWTKGEHYKETLAGNDIKMGTGYPRAPDGSPGERTHHEKRSGSLCGARAESAHESRIK
ncbi:MAG: glycoside hydrolase family 3 N-terminal domain-containing protein [Lachnospiraceae bacterium]